MVIKAVLKIALLAGLVSCETIVISDNDSTHAPHSAVDVQAQNHAESGTQTNGTEFKSLKRRMEAIVVDYCKDADIEDAKLQAVQKCFSWRAEMDAELLMKCEDEAYGEDKTLNDRRKFQCKSRENRSETKKVFWKCYVTGAKEQAAAGDDKALKHIYEIQVKRQMIKAMSQDERREQFGQFILSITICMEDALKL